MPVVRIREATVFDMPDLQDVYRRSSLSNRGDRASLLANPDALVLPDTAVRQGRTRVAVHEDGTVIGFVTVGLVGRRATLDDLFVDPDWMRQGVGRSLVEDLVGMVSQRAVDRVEVVANPHALSFYRCVGFVIDSTVETRFGPGFRMHLDLPEPAPS